MYLKAYAGIYISTEESLRNLQIMENTAKTIYSIYSKSL